MCWAAAFAPLLTGAAATTAATVVTGALGAGLMGAMAPKPSSPADFTAPKAADPVTPPPTSAASQESEASVLQQRKIDSLRAGFASTLKTGSAGVSSSPATLTPAITGKKGLIGQ